MAFDHVVSIGGNCDAAHHVRRHYDIRVSMPMDWLILPFAGAISLFDEGFSDLIHLDRLALWRGTRHAIQCSRRGLVFQHDFSRDAASLVVVDNIQAEFDGVKARYARRVERLRALCRGGRSILFVRSWREILHAPSDYPQRCIRGVPDYPFRDLLDAIGRCFPDIRFTVLFVNYGEQGIDDPRAVFANVPDMGDVADWAGSPGGWDRVLEGLPLKRGVPAGAEGTPRFPGTAI